MTPFRLRSALTAVTAAAVLTTTLAGCSMLFPNTQADAERDETGAVAEGANSDIFALKVGDCLPGDGIDGDTGDTDVVPCSEPHAEEVYSEFEMTGVSFPGRDAIGEKAEVECGVAFADFVGREFDDSALDYYWLAPTEGSWTNLKDRLVQCIAFDPADDQIVGTLAGADR